MRENKMKPEDYQLYADIVDAHIKELQSKPFNMELIEALCMAHDMLENAATIPTDSEGVGAWVQ